MQQLWRWFWRAVCRFAYRRWAVPDGEKPVGIPFNRDPGNPCSSYEPRKWKPGDWRDCMTDGHYLCGECCHRAEPLAEDEEGDSQQ